MKNLKPKEVGLFNPKAIDEDILRVKIIFNNVYSFTDRLKHLATLNKEVRIKEVLPIYLKRTVLTQYNTELTTIEREFLTIALIITIID